MCVCVNALFTYLICFNAHHNPLNYFSDSRMGHNPELENYYPDPTFHFVDMKIGVEKVKTVILTLNPLAEVPAATSVERSSRHTGVNLREDT